MNIFLKKKKLKVLKSDELNKNNFIEIKYTRVVHGGSITSNPTPEIPGTVGTLSNIVK